MGRFSGLEMTRESRMALLIHNWRPFAVDDQQQPLKL